MIVQEPYFNLLEPMMHRSTMRKRRAPTERPAAIRPLGATGKVPVTRSERMDAILKPKTMAGSQDADAVFGAASRRLAHGFLFCGVRLFAKP
jgi:hypothetical protein